MFVAFSFELCSMAQLNRNSKRKNTTSQVEFMFTYVWSELRRDICTIRSSGTCHDHDKISLNHRIQVICKWNEMKWEKKNKNNDNETIRITRWSKQILTMMLTIRFFRKWLLMLLQRSFCQPYSTAWFSHFVAFFISIWSISTTTH